MKTVPYSVRLSSEDAEFLASLNIEGALTPSDKLRAIVGEAREKANRKTDYQSYMKALGEMTALSYLDLKEKEHQNSMQSEIVQSSVDLAKEILASFLSSTECLKNSKKEDEISKLKALESDIADKLFLMFERLSLLGIREESKCYTPNAVSSRMKSVKEIVKIMINESSKE
jgi:hypothetical protein